MRHPELNVLINNAGVMPDDDPGAPVDDEALTLGLRYDTGAWQLA